jgi:hypothetical protein
MSVNSPEGLRSTKKGMKIMKRTFLIAAAVAGAFTLAANAEAGSPKGDQWAENHQRVAAPMPTDQITKPVSVGYQAVGDDGIAASPKFRQMLDERKAREVAVNSAQDVDYVNAKRPSFSPHDSRFEAAWRENAVPEVQVAPLK